YDVKYVDTEGKEVAKSRHFEGEEGAAFVTSAKEVAGYKLVRTEGAVLNVFIAGAQVRTYVYEKVNPEAKPNIQVPKQAPTEAAKPALSPEALTRLTTWYNQAKDLLKDDQVKDKYVDILAVQKAVDQAYDHVEEGKFITTDQANQLANKLRDALQSLELKDNKVAKPVAKGTYDVKYVDTEGKEVAKSRHFEGEEGAAFVTSAKEVAGYKLV
ncbi:MucBP domain-containing protein, partial [Streptococcus agalactiae]|nr:MucBP domain-containing protein [Streptococcus agalactiae]